MACCNRHTPTHRTADGAAAVVAAAHAGLASGARRDQPRVAHGCSERGACAGGRQRAACAAAPGLPDAPLHPGVILPLHAACRWVGGWVGGLGAVLCAVLACRFHKHCHERTPCLRAERIPPPPPPLPPPLPPPPRRVPQPTHAHAGAESNEELSSVHLDSDAMVLAVEDTARAPTPEALAAGAKGAGVALVLAFRCVCVCVCKCVCVCVAVLRGSAADAITASCGCAAAVLCMARGCGGASRLHCLCWLKMLTDRASACCLARMLPQGHGAVGACRLSERL
jgi:hypothetical protein